MKRTIAVLVALVTGGLAMLAISLAQATPTGADQFAKIQFDDTARTVTLVIPTPSCRPQGCQWELFVDEPDVAGQPVVGTASAPVGSILVDYPDGFCGVIQADAGVLSNADGSFHKEVGFQHQIVCAPPPTTTTSTTVPECPNRPATANCQPVQPPVTSPPSSSPPSAPQAPSAPPVAPTATGAPPASPAPTGAPSPSPVGPVLAYTGPPVGVWWLAAVGSAGVLAGLALMRRRRVTP